MYPTIERVVLDALRLANRSRPPQQQLAVTPDATLYGSGSQLDSLGLVAFVLDVEDGLRALGHDLSLTDASALSRRHSPFRTVPTLVNFILEQLGDGR